MFLDSHWLPEDIFGRTEEGLVAASIVVTSIACWVGFNPERLNSFKTEIGQTLLNINPEFMTTGYQKGMSFLRFVWDSNGIQWGGQQSADRLIALGMAFNWVTFPTPRDTWKALPGGVPYVIIHDDLIKAYLETVA
jgi:hypothetical protein